MKYDDDTDERIHASKKRIETGGLLFVRKLFYGSYDKKQKLPITI